MHIVPKVTRSWLFLLLSSFNLFIHAQLPAMQWVKTISNPDMEAGTAVLADASGNVYTTGQVGYGISDLDPGPGSFTVNNVNSMTTMFVVKTDAAGNFLWGKTFTCTSSTANYIQSLALDAAANLYITGTFNGIIDFDPGQGVTQLTTGNNDEDIFVVKLTSQGNFVWADKIGGPTYDSAEDIVIDPSGNVILVGIFTNSCDFDPGPNSYILSTSNNDLDGFVMKLGSNGAFIWAGQYGGTITEGTSAVDTDLSGNIFVAGNFRGVIDLDIGSGVANFTSNIGDLSGFVTMLAPTGFYLWGRQLTGKGLARIFDIKADVSGNTFFCGGIDDSTDLDPGPGVHMVAAKSIHDPVIVRLDAMGNFIWGKVINGNSPTAFAHAFSLDLNSNNDLFVFGEFRNSFDFDPGNGVTTLTTADDDMFMLKLNSAGIFGWAFSFGGITTQTSPVEIGRWISCDNAGNIYATGRFISGCDFAPGAATYTLNSQNGDAYIYKLSTGSTAGLHQENTRVQNHFYPNPSGGIFRWSQQAETISGYEVYNATGNLVMLKEGGDEIDLVLQPAGIYFVKFTVAGNDRTQLVKLLKY